MSQEARFPSGKYFRGFLASDTLNVDAALPLFDMDGVAITLAKGERPVIEEIEITNGATAAVVTIYADTDGSATYQAGEELFVCNLPVAGQASFPQAGGVLAGRVSDGATKNKLRAVASAASVGTKINVIGAIINS